MFPQKMSIKPTKWKWIFWCTKWKWIFWCIATKSAYLNREIHVQFIKQYNTFMFYEVPKELKRQNLYILWTCTPFLICRPSKSTSERFHYTFIYILRTCAKIKYVLLKGAQSAKNLLFISSNIHLKFHFVSLL